MLWKIFFWFSVVAAVFAVIALTTVKTSLIDVLVVADFIIAVIGLYAYIYKKPIFTPTFWYWFFWLNLAYDITYVCYGLAPTDPILKNVSFLISQPVQDKYVYIISGLLDIPMLYAFWHLAKPTSKAKKK